MTIATMHLYFLRLSALLTQSALLIAGTVLFAFGMLDLFNVLAVIAVALAWLIFCPATVRALARVQHPLHELATHVDAAGRPLTSGSTHGVTVEQFSALRAFRARSRARRTLLIPRDRFDMALATTTTLVWLSYFGFIGTVLAGV